MLLHHRHNHRQMMIMVVLIAGLLLPGLLLADEVNPVRQQQLVHLLQQDCGSCHGLTLKGGLGPALTVNALKDKPKEAMVATILSGRPGTPMPPWSNQLTEQDVRWLVEYLYQGGK